MSFNLGYQRLSLFRKLIAAVKSSDWNAAAAEMQNSNWAKQVGRRATRNIESMKNNTIPQSVILF
jgi:lysozyme